MIVFKRHARKTIVTVRPQGGLDRGGKPTYGTGKNQEAWVARTASVTHTGTGDEIGTPYTVWFDGDAKVTAQLNDLVEEDGKVLGVVIERVEGKRLQSGQIDHVRVRLREK